ncbi:hypothetical protein vBValSX1_23 [Vibrio phage vB_ValS_X1]|uniref:Uncharacterized protein n=1 Tax=Vibrio phage vB_ValS_X1 TaxID=2736341 RepID=A0A6M9Z6T4_9CAUD|nr:hypothetical protein vBValSX1_23 [Vibrio phage vB_ValS_X1]
MSRKQISEGKFNRVMEDPNTDFCTFQKGIYRSINRNSLLVRKMKRLHALSEVTNQPGSNLKLVLNGFMYYKWNDSYWRRPVVAKTVYFLAGELTSNAKA